MSDQITEHIKPSLENTAISPPPDTGIVFRNPESKDAEELHKAAEEIGGKVIGSITPASNLGNLNHVQFEEPVKAMKIDPSTLSPKPETYAWNDPRRWLAEKVFGRRGKNAA